MTAPKRPDPLRERISALPSLPIPTAKPVREDTVTDGVLGPAPGSYRRKDSPPPISNPAPRSVPTTAQERELVALRAEVAELKEGAERGQATTVVRHEYGVDSATRKWLYGLVTVVLGSTGLSIYSAFKPAEVPPPTPLPCEFRCPAGDRSRIDMRQPPAELQAAMQCCEVMTAVSAAKAALDEARNARELAGKASDKATAVERATPKVNP